jgi:group I intron endonuclease
MFGKSHTSQTKKLMSIKRSIRPLGLYNTDNNLLEKFLNQVELAKKFGVYKTTISRYIRSGKLFKGKYYIKEIKD